MRIFLLNQNAVMEDCWNAYFSNEPDVSVICETLEQFLSHVKVDCVVSPANSYGLMDGGFDLAISEYFGWNEWKKPQDIVCFGAYQLQDIDVSREFE